MKRYISPEIEVVTVNTLDIMALSGNSRDDGTDYSGPGVDMGGYWL